MQLTPTSLVGALALLAPFARAIPAPAAEAAANSSDFKACLNQYPFEKSFPADSSYSAYTRAENENLNYQAAVIALPSSQAGAVDVVKCVAAQNGAQKLAVRGGGHSYEAYGLGGGNGWAVLDLRKFDSISIDKNARTATVGAGVRLGALALQLAQAGFALPHGTCAYVGVAGHGLGGGYGFASRNWGYLLDHITSMQVILPSGDVVTASATSNPDLFHALRGGGQNNFGAVLSFTYALETAPTQIIDFSYAYKTNNDCVAALLAFQDVLGSSDASKGFPAPITPELLWVGEKGANGGPACTISGQHIGATRAQHDDVFNRFRTLTRSYGNGTDYDQSSTQIQSFTSWQSALASDLVMGGFDVSNPNANHEPYYAKSLVQPNSIRYTKQNAQALMNKLNSVSGADGTGTSIAFAGFGPLSQANAVSASATAYSHRDTLFLYQFYSYGAKTNTVVSNLGQLVNQAKSIAPSSDAWGAYVNYVDRNLQGWAAAYYGSALEQLKALKQQLDPNNIFDYAQGLAHA